MVGDSRSSLSTANGWFTYFLRCWTLRMYSRTSSSDTSPRTGCFDLSFKNSSRLWSAVLYQLTVLADFPSARLNASYWRMRRSNWMPL